MNRIHFLAALAISAAITAPSFAQNAGGTPADNSKTNKLDGHVTSSADAQKNDATDLSLTRRIRKSVMADKGLSTYGHNVKIVAVSGTVTLNGPVRSEAEKSSIQAKAVSIAGEEHVVNQMTIAAPKS